MRWPGPRSPGHRRSMPPTWPQGARAASVRPRHRGAHRTAARRPRRNPGRGPRISCARAARGTADGRAADGCEHARHHLLPFTDARFPKLLRALADCPIALYVAGSIDALGDPQLAVVGSRNPTPQGRETAFDFARTPGAARARDHQRAGARASTQRLIAARWRRRASRSPCSATGSTWSIRAATASLSGIIRAARRPGQRVSAGHGRRGAANFPRRNRIIAALTPRHPGGRGGAAKRLADHRARGQRLRPGGLRHSRARSTTP